MKRALIEGIPILSADFDELRDATDELLAAAVQKRVMYVNIHVLNTANQEPRLKEILKRADLVYCDGQGVSLGARMLGNDFGDRLTATDFIYPLCEHAAARGHSLFLLAGVEGVASEAAAILRRRFPGLRIAGVHHGYFNKSDCGDVIRLINESRPDILFVGFGTPVQEYFIADHASSIDARLIWAVGAVFDFVSGRLTRGPMWLNKRGMEWLGRLISEPRRLWKRYLVGNFAFFVRILYRRHIKRSQPAA